MSKTTAPKTFIFVLMPFDELFDDVYKVGIKPACKDAGAYCERVDEQIFHDSILDRIYNQISKADFIVADVTGRNPNVFYEIGYAHALDKPVILVTQDANDIPFDLKHYPHIVYEKKISSLKDELERRILWFIENIEKAKNISTDELDFFISGNSIDTRGNIPINISRHGQHSIITLDIHNSTSRIVQGKKYKFAIISDSYFLTSSKNIQLPDKKNLFSLGNVEMGSALDT